MRLRTALLSSACVIALLSGQAYAAPEVGVAAAVNQSAEAIPPGGSIRSITLGDNVIHNERITTGEGGLVQILLVDGTTFTVGENSDLVIDKFVYDPEAGTAEVLATLAKGALRVMGGKAAKTTGATINTPVGTVGIRGSGVEILPGADDGAGTETYNCLAGTCSYTPPGSDQPVTFQQGESIEVSTDTNGVVSVSPPAKTTKQQAAKGTNRIGSKPGTTGGASSQTSGNVGNKLGNGPGGLGGGGEPGAPPPPENDPTGPDNNVIKDANNNPTPPSPPPGPPPSPPPAPEPIHARVLTSGDTYELTWGHTIPDGGLNTSLPGVVGLVGNTDHDEVVLFAPTTLPNNPNVVLGTGDILGLGTEDPSFVLPFGTGNTLGSTQDYVIEESPVGPLTGTLFTRNDFNFLALFYDYDTGEGTVSLPLYVVSGTPTDFADVFLNQEDPKVRRYELSMDPIQQVPVPFFRDGVIDDFSNAAISDVLLVESPDTDQHARALETWLVINGTGADQQSAVGVTAGSFFDDGTGDYIYGSSRRGSYRADSADPSSIFYGSLNSVAGPDGGDQVFGPNGENFLLSTDISGGTRSAITSARATRSFSTRSMSPISSMTTSRSRRRLRIVS